MQENINHWLLSYLRLSEGGGGGGAGELAVLLGRCRLHCGHPRAALAALGREGDTPAGSSALLQVSKRDSLCAYIVCLCEAEALQKLGDWEHALVQYARAARLLPAPAPPALTAGAALCRENIRAEVGAGQRRTAHWTAVCRWVWRGPGAVSLWLELCYTAVIMQTLPHNTTENFRLCCVNIFLTILLYESRPWPRMLRPCSECRVAASVGTEEVPGPVLVV